MNALAADRPAADLAPSTRPGVAAGVREPSAAWCVTIWPTPALAQQAGMDDRAYAEFVERALFLDQPDPVAAWRALRSARRS